MIPTKKPPLREEFKAVEGEFFRTITTLIVSSFGLVAALAWNTAITKILEQYLVIRPESTVVSWLIYAIIVTVIAVIITVYLSRWGERLAEKNRDRRQVEN